MDFFLNSKLRIWPPDLVNYKYAITSLFKYPATHTLEQTPTFHRGNVCKHIHAHIRSYSSCKVSHPSQEPGLVARHEFKKMSIKCSEPSLTATAQLHPRPTPKHGHCLTCTSFRKQQSVIIAFRIKWVESCKSYT